MKLPRQNSDVQRDFTPRRQGDLAIGRVGRIYRKEKTEGNGLRKKRRRRVSRSKGNRARRLWVMTWSLVGLTATVGVLVTAFLFWLWPQMKGKDASWRSLEESDRMLRVVTKFEAPIPEVAQKIVANALTVADEAEVDKWIRRGNSSAAEVIAFMRDVKATDGEPSERLWLGSVDRNGLQLDGIELIFLADEKQKHRLALLVPDDQGVWRMDFGAFARTMEPSWDKLIARYPAAGDGEEPAEPPPTGVLRVLFVGDTYYNGPFSDEQIWIAFGMLSPDHDDIQLIGYCKNGSLQHRAMQHILSKWPEDVLPRITVEVRRVAGAEARQLEITGVLAEDWVVGDKKFEDLIEQGWR